VGLPDAVDDGRMARIARGTVVEFTAEIDDLHDWYPLRRDGPNGRWTGAKCWRFSGLSARQPKRCGVPSLLGGARARQRGCMDFSLANWRAGEFGPGQSLGLSAICPICSQKQPRNGHRRTSQGRKFQATYAAIDVTRRLFDFLSY
jgi:hypothetical protein